MDRKTNARQLAKENHVVFQSDSANRTQQLIDEVEEIAALLEKWKHETDPESCWIMHMLDSRLERRKSILRQLLH